MTEPILRLTEEQVQRITADVASRFTVDVEAAMAEGYRRAIAMLRDGDAYADYRRPMWELGHAPTTNATEREHYAAYLEWAMAPGADT
jgi:hypothetical protein